MTEDTQYELRRSSYTLENLEEMVHAKLQGSYGFNRDYVLYYQMIIDIEQALATKELVAVLKSFKENN